MSDYTTACHIDRLSLVLGARHKVSYLYDGFAVEFDISVHPSMRYGDWRLEEGLGLGGWAVGLLDGWVCD